MCKTIREKYGLPLDKVGLLGSSKYRKNPYTKLSPSALVVSTSLI